LVAAEAVAVLGKDEGWAVGLTWLRIAVSAGLFLRLLFWILALVNG